MLELDLNSNQEKLLKDIMEKSFRSHLSRRLPGVRTRGSVRRRGEGAPYTGTPDDEERILEKGFPLELTYEEQKEIARLIFRSLKEGSELDEIFEIFNIDNLVLEERDKSESYIGHVDISFTLFAKAANEVQSQADYIRDLPQNIAKKFVAILPVRFNKKTVINNRELAFCIMEPLSNFKSLHNILFSSQTDGARLDSILDTLRTCLCEVYRPLTCQSRPRSDELYLDGIERGASDAGVECRRLDDVLTNAIKRVKCDLDKVTAPFITFVHGDLNAENIMVRDNGKSIEIRFIDPNPKRAYTDYVYDLGRLLHWIELGGVLDHARDIGETEPLVRRPCCCEDTFFPYTYNEHYKKLLEGKRRRINKIQSLCRDVAAKIESGCNWRYRLNLSTATSHFKAIPHWNIDDYKDWLFRKGLERLHRLIGSLAD